MTSTPTANISFAVARVMPKPPAMFSPFSTTKSSASFSRSIGSSAATTSRPGFPIASPMKRICMRSVITHSAFRTTGLSHGNKQDDLASHLGTHPFLYRAGRGVVLAGGHVRLVGRLGLLGRNGRVRDRDLRLASHPRSRALAGTIVGRIPERTSLLGQGAGGISPARLCRMDRIHGLRQALGPLAHAAH